MEMMIIAEQLVYMKYKIMNMEKKIKLFYEYCRVMLLCLFGSNYLMSVSTANAALTDKLQDTCRQVQEWRERLEQPHVQLKGKVPQKTMTEQDSGVLHSQCASNYS